MMELMWPPLLLSLVLVGIHAYYGLEVIRRGIIFTDLAIGQTAALGAALSILLLDGAYLYPLSIFFALSAGLLVALASKRERHLEALIGLLYALGSSGTVLVLSKTPHGAETLQSLLAADILFTQNEEIFHAFLLYSIIAAVLYFIYQKRSGTMRDVLFFLTFSVTVASSVKLAGVLVVFAMLVAPAFIVLKGGFQRPLLWAWGVGTVVNMLGVLISYVYDYPTGYMIVFVHALAAIIASFWQKADHADNRNH